ncbi:hypothetical protein JRQ81_019037 [Phrynocephalus forsythii]|uniref:Microtubule-associated protein n=1 Tax=Phrynocephalus forsythii TaxID=171643 RepID=A0A9Q0XQC0_9SAUR|nr:hypothetical protein JRQ81_019037 [Phrynocephalus forsythii]
MADLDHNLSLADALTEPPPQIEEEVKRDFMATLEAEKFDDVIGETVGKTDYIPLLDDDDPKAGNQEAKTKPHAENVQADRKSATGPAAVLENGDHGVEGGRQVSPGKIIDEKMSYKEFLDRNESWTMEDRGHCFESQPAFKPMDVTEPFTMNREDVLSDLLLLPQETMGVPQFGEYFGASEGVQAPFGVPGVPEQLNPLGSLHAPPNLFDPMGFLGADPGAETQLNQREAAFAREMGSPEDFWLGPQRLVEGKGAPFFETPVPGTIPGAAEKHSPVSPGLGLMDVVGQPKLPEVKASAPAAPPAVGSPAGPFPVAEEMMGFEPSFDHKPLPPKTSPAGSPEAAGTKEPKGKAADPPAPAGNSPVSERPVEIHLPPPQPKEKEESSKAPSPAEAKNPPPSPKAEGDGKASLKKPAEEEAAAAKPPGPKAEEVKPSLALREEKKETQPPSPKADTPKASPEQPRERPEETKVSPAQQTQGAAGGPSAPHKAEEVKASPPKPEKKAEEGKLSSGEEAKAPSSSSSSSSSPALPKAPPLPSPEKREEKRQPPPVEKPEGHETPPQAKPLEQALKPPAGSQEPSSPGEPKADAKEPPPEKPTVAPAEVAKPKEGPQPRPDQPVELPQENGLPGTCSQTGRRKARRRGCNSQRHCRPTDQGASTKPREENQAFSLRFGSKTCCSENQARSRRRRRRRPPTTKRPASATPGQNKKATSPTAGPAAATTPKRPATSTTRPSTLTPKDVKPKGTEVKSPDKRTSPLKPPSATTPRPSTKSSPATPRPPTAQTSVNASSPRTTATSPPKRPSTIKTDAKAADVKKTTAKSPSADASRPKSAPASTTPSPGPPGTAAPASRPKPKPAVPKTSGTASTTAADAKKTSAPKTAPKTCPVPKPSRPPTSVSAPDLKNVRSKIGSTDNIKYQPGGGKAKVERKAESAGAARKPELNAVVSKTATTKTAVTKEGSQKQANGKVQIVSKKANYSHVQSKCGSKDNIKHVPGGGNVPNAPKPASGNHCQPSTAPRPGQGSSNVQILNKKIDLSKVSSKCGSKANIKHKPGGGDVKIENQKLNFKEKAQAKVGSLDNVGHVPAGGTVKTEGGEEAAPQNGAVTAPPPGSGARQENGVGPAAPVQGSGDQREMQSFDTHIQETN